MADRVNPVYDGALTEPITERDLEEEQPVFSYQDKQQVFLSMVRARADLRNPRPLVASLTLIAAVLLLVDVGLGVHYSELTDGHITFEDVTLINHELIRLHDEYKIAMESVAYANRRLANEISQQQLSKWELEHQIKRKTDSEAETTKLQTQITALQTHLTMTREGCRRCSPGWILMSSLCYYFPFSGVNTMKSWQQARDFCKAQGGDLAIIDSKDKEVSIVKLLEMNVDPSTSYSSKTFWIGLRDVHEEGTWKWLNGRTLVEGYWNDGQPNNSGDEDCVLVFSKANPFKAWSDSSCTSRAKWICEMPPKTPS